MEATGLPKSSSVGGSAVFVSVRVDSQACGKSPSVSPTPSARWSYREELRCPPGASSLILEVKRAGLTGSHYVGGCSIQISDISVMDNEVLPLFDASAREVGQLRVSIQRLGGPAGHAPSGGLANQAGGAFARAGTGSVLGGGAPSPAGAFAGRSGTGSMLGGPGPSALPGGLTNMAGLHNEAAGGSSFHPSASSSYRAGASFQDVPGETLDGRSRSRANTLGGRGQGEDPGDAFSERGSMSVPTASFGGLVNHAAENRPWPPPRPPRACLAPGAAAG
ncbi:unnamed protein product [Prorocentrum cordatum]|uniref:C2 NT-type domain-containing protein n=1 Tax=Prorocentrum cordatum TaxID=2364126 RepID=A0ABN9XJ19_9DINO|nr:unnamed protein product [Polarella glacialis]